MLIKGYERAKLTDYLRRSGPSSACIVFWHGLGDLVMFLPTFWKLAVMFPDIKIKLGLQDGVGQEFIVPDALLLKDPNREVPGYDITFQVHYWMSEQMMGRWTKNEWCCLYELGIDPMSAYPMFKRVKPVSDRNLVAVHFQATALPDDCNPSEAIAKQIWNEVHEAGFVPIESHFQHVYHNSVNEKFSFIPEGRTARSLPATIKNLMLLLQTCTASIGVSSGNFHMSMAIMPGRTMYLRKKFPVACYTKQGVPEVDVNSYEEGTVKEWLRTL